MLTVWLGKCCANGRVEGCKIILIGDSSGGNLVLGTARWLRDENLLPPPDGLLLLSVRRSHHFHCMCLTPLFPALPSRLAILVRLVFVLIFTLPCSDFPHPR